MNIINKNFEKIKAGDEILFSGYLYTARDQAHARFVKMIKARQKLPLDLKNKIIYYCGPTANPIDKIIGSCGPTTSSRMDTFTQPLFEKGLKGMVGKGRRSRKVRQLIKRFKGVYFVAPAGCGAMLATKVRSKKLICFKDLGPEAVYELRVEEFPLVVAIDSAGRSIYKDL